MLPAATFNVSWFTAVCVPKYLLASRIAIASVMGMSTVEMLESIRDSS
jgi:hypothetical protein